MFAFVRHEREWRKSDAEHWYHWWFAYNKGADNYEAANAVASDRLRTDVPMIVCYDSLNSLTSTDLKA